MTLQFSVGSSGVSAPYYLAAEKGYFRAVGINIKLLEGGGSSTTAQIVANGSAQFGNVDAGTLAALVGQGLPIKVVAQIVQLSVIGVASLAETGIQKPKDLEGKKVGQTVGGAGATLFPAFAAANGVDLNKVTVVSLGQNARLAALIEKKTDASIEFLTNVVLLEAEGKKSSVLLYSDHGVNTMGDTITTSKAIIEQRPDLIRRFLSAVVKGWDESKKNPEEAIRIYVKDKPELKEQIALGQLKIYLDRLHTKRTEGKTVGFSDPQDWEELVNILSKANMIKDRKPVAEYITNEFLPR